MPHLTYVGDATIGEQTNIGAAQRLRELRAAATKSRTVIGSHVRTGCDTMFVAPVTDRRRGVHGGRFGDRQGRAAGRARRWRGRTQRNIEGWVRRSRPGSAAAEAARAGRAGGRRRGLNERRKAQPR